MNEIQINAQFGALAEQRNNAMNHVINLIGENVILRAKIADLESKFSAENQQVAKESENV